MDVFLIEALRADPGFLIPITLWILERHLVRTSATRLSIYNMKILIET